LTAGSVLPSVLQQTAGDYVDSQGRHLSFSGAFNLQWSPNGGEQGFEVEQSTDNQTWQVLGDVAATATTFALSGLANNQYFFRLRSFYPGQIGLYVTPPSNVIGVLVNQRTKAEITSLVKTAISNVSLSGGLFQFDLNMMNQSSNTYVPLVEFKIVSISSGSGTVVAINADNGGNGTGVGNAALFDFSHQLGAAETFAPGQVSGSRTMRFQDSASELFTYSAIVTAYQQVATGSSSGSPPAGAGSPSGTSGTSGSTTSLAGLKSLLRFTVNPATNSVVVQVVSLN
jgi:hypothetical protein